MIDVRDRTDVGRVGELRVSIADLAEVVAFEVVGYCELSATVPSSVLVMVVFDGHQE